MLASFIALLDWSVNQHICNCFVLRVDGIMEVAVEFTLKLSGLGPLQIGWSLVQVMGWQARSLQQLCIFQPDHALCALRSA